MANLGRKRTVFIIPDVPSFALDGVLHPPRRSWSKGLSSWKTMTLDLWRRRWWRNGDSWQISSLEEKRVNLKVCPCVGGHVGGCGKKNKTQILYSCLHLSEFQPQILDLLDPPWVSSHHPKWPDDQVGGLLILSKLEVKWNLWEI